MNPLFHTTLEQGRRFLRCTISLRFHGEGQKLLSLVSYLQTQQEIGFLNEKEEALQKQKFKVKRFKNTHNPPPEYREGN